MTWAYLLHRTPLWLGQALAALLFLFWGAFFWAHLQEWFFNPRGMIPPTHVWIGQFLHLLMLAGLALLIFRPVPGAVLTAAATIAFFSWIQMARFPWIALANLLPIILILGYRILAGRFFRVQAST